MKTNKPDDFNDRVIFKGQKRYVQYRSLFGLDLLYDAETGKPWSIGSITEKQNDTLYRTIAMTKCHEIFCLK